MKLTAEKMIGDYQLERHVEGGFFRQLHESDEKVKRKTPSRKGDSRSACTSIFYLLKEDEQGVDDRSVFHKLDAEETWCFHMGRALRIYILNRETKQLETHILGGPLVPGANFTLTVPKHTWFSTEMLPEEECKEDELGATVDFSISTCFVAPGFDYKGFSIIHTQEELDELKNEYPTCSDVIERMTKIRPTAQVEQAIEENIEFQKRSTPSQ